MNNKDAKPGIELGSPMWNANVLPNGLFGRTYAEGSICEQNCKFGHNCFII